MADDLDFGAIARRLTLGQRSVIEGLNLTPQVFGCGEEIAIRLSKPTSRRPALVAIVPGEPWRKFFLNEAGIAVRRFLC